jgi:hypothetical protein
MLLRVLSTASSVNKGGVTGGCLLRTKFSTYLYYAVRICVFAGAICICAPMVVREACIALHARAVRKAANAKEIATACVQLLQTEKEGGFIGSSEIDAIPPVLRPMHPRSIFIDPRPPVQRVMVEFGGGFFHYGYELKALPPESGGWSFSYYGENEEDRVQLLTLPR